MFGDDNDAGYDPGYYSIMDPYMDLVLRVVLVGACANEPRNFDHLNRAIEVAMRSFFPDKRRKTPIDVEELLDLLVSEGKLERIWYARSDKRTAENAMFAVPVSRRLPPKRSANEGRRR